MERLRVVPAVLAALAMLLALGSVLAPSASAAGRQEATLDRLLDDAGWHGRPVQEPHPHTAVKASTTSLPGWSAGPVALGTGASRAGGSERVRELQRRLRRLGYGTGSVDGVFGPRTRAALAWFQHKHGLPPDGRSSSVTVRHLRARTGAPAADRPAAPDGEPAQAPEPVRPPAVVPAPEIAQDTDPSWLRVAVPGLLLLGVALLTFALVLERRRRRQDVPPRREHAPAVAAQRLPRAPRAVGYVRLASGAPSASFHAQAAAIEAGCLARGMTLVSLVSDRDPGRTAQDPPPALSFALERLATGDVDRLVVSRLDHLAETREDLAPLLRSVADRHAGLVVLDRDLDTAELPDPVAPEAVLRRAPEPRTRRPVQDAARAVDAHIASMLEEGARPEEVVAALNAEPVPIPAGEAWTPSRVQAAAGRRRGRAAGREERFHG